jgi:hypothetical protein
VCRLKTSDVTSLQGYPISTEASWVNFHMTDPVAAPVELWAELYSEAAMHMPCSYHLNGHPVHQRQPPRRINSLMVEGGLDGTGYRCSSAPMQSNQPHLCSYFKMSHPRHKAP